MYTSALSALFPTNACRSDEFEVKCAGTAALGLCSTWIGAEDGGQYFLVNAQAPVPALSLSADGSAEMSAPDGTTSSIASVTHFAASTTDLPPTDYSDTSASPSSSPSPSPAPTTATPSSSPSSSPAPTAASHGSPRMPSWAIILIVLLCAVPVAAVLVILFRRFRLASSRTWRYRPINAYPTSAQLPAEGLIEHYAPPSAPPPKSRQFYANDRLAGSLADRGGDDHGSIESSLTPALTVDPALPHRRATARSCIHSMYTGMDWLHPRRRSDHTACIPTELFFAFFQPLPFDDLLAASRVSRHWRAAALQFAHLWSDVRIDRQICDPASLLDAVLPRSGSLPISLEYIDIDGTQTPSARLGEALAPYLPRITHLVWSGAIGWYLPEMANLVRLSLTLPQDSAACEYLPQLFDMVQRLRHLSLYGLTSVTSQLLPARATPRSLVRLDVETSDTTCDPIPLLRLWRTRQLRAVHFVFVLPFQGHRLSANIAPLLAGAVGLSIAHAYRSTYARITVRHESGVETDIEYHWSIGRERRPPGRWLAKMLCWQGRQFSSTLRSLRIPLHELRAFRTHFWVRISSLVRLNSVHIVVRCIHWGKVGFLRIPWDVMGCIACLRELPALDELTFDFVDLPSRADELHRFFAVVLAECRPSPGVPLLEIIVRGIPAERWPRRELCEVSGLSLSFVE